MTGDGSTPEGREVSAHRQGPSLPDFLELVRARVGPGEDAEAVGGVTPGTLFSWGESVGMSAEDLVREVSEFTGIPLLAEVGATDADPRILPLAFCRAHTLVALRSVGTRQTVLLSNPFDWELLDDLERTLPRGRQLALLLAPPAAIGAILDRLEAGEGMGAAERRMDAFQLRAETERRPEAVPPARADLPPEASAAPGRPPLERAGSPPSAGVKTRVYDPEKDPGRGHPVARLAVELLRGALAEGATELTVEPRGSGAAARVTLGGTLHDLQEMPLDTARQLVARWKALAGMDVARRRTPQRGVVEIRLPQGTYRLRLATSPTPAFEHLRLRVLDPEAEAEDLSSLGLEPDQVEALLRLAGRESGLLLMSGPADAGKTTTATALLASVASQERRLVTVEDVVERRVPFSTRLEVDEGAGRGWSARLSEAIQGEPDVLFLGETFEQATARACVDYAMAGHLVLAGVSSSNATAALFHLERLGVSRAALASCLIGTVGQRLLKRLCPECREVRSLREEERGWLSPFEGAVPAEVAEPAGCSACRGTGYAGLEGVFEVIEADGEIRRLIEEGVPLARLREEARARGCRLLSDHAIEKVRRLVLPLQDVYREILLEEGAPAGAPIAMGAAPGPAALSGDGGGEAGPAALDASVAGAVGRPALLEQRTVLVVEDDEDTRTLLDRLLSRAGYRVIQAADGAEALLCLGRERMDVILSDIHMPTLDGLKLLEIVHQHAIAAPVILLSAESAPEFEERARVLGAARYLHKPIRKEALLAALETALGHEEGGETEGGSAGA